MLQFRLGTLLLGVAGLAFGLAFGRESGFRVVFAASSAWIALGLLQQSRDLWEARSQLTTCDRPVVWGWRYAVAWRIVIATTIGGYWIIDSLEASELIRFVSATDDIQGTEALSRGGLIYLALVMGLSSTPGCDRGDLRPYSPCCSTSWAGPPVFAWLAWP